MTRQARESGRDENRTTKRAVLFGASGLVGNECLKLLLQTYDEVVAFVRKPLNFSDPKLQTVIIDFEHLEKHAEQIRGDALFCCLGSTIKKAGSQAVFRKVDFNYPVELARIAKRNGIKKFLVVSAVGANSKSRSFYIRVKGEMEEAISVIGLEEVHFFRPSFLLGQRAEHRPFEQLALRVLKPVTRLFIGPLKKFRPVEARAVAQAMIDVSMLKARPGVRFH